MTPDRWQRVKEICEAALELGSESRTAYLDRACEQEDEEVRREVESLLASHDAAPDFMNEPAVVSSVRDLLGEVVKLSAGERFGRFEIVSLIGEGGMGEVYLAEDAQLNRRVALKLLSVGALASEDADKRFRREARVAAGLDHPHICAVYEVGEVGGRGFIAMQYVEGETLEARMKSKPLTLFETLNIGVQIADALTEAHARGIVHRDIKPSNVMLTAARGAVKVMDFGLAKPTEAGGALTSGESETQSFITTPGTIIGTVPYMSPEQVRGEWLDARSDLFSFGVVLYEMVAGQRPFAAASAAGLISAIISDEPPPLARFSRDVSEEFERIVDKSLRKDREERYQTAKDLLIDLRQLKKQLEFRAGAGRSAPANDNQKQSATHRFSAHRTAGAPAGGAAGGRRNLVVLSAALLLLLGAAGLGYWFFKGRDRRAPPIKSLAVLPFVNESGDADVEYLSDGMTETLISSLSRLPELSVKARSTVFRYKGKEQDAPKIGKELNVQGILHGRVTQRGDRLTLSLELVDALTENVVWSERYDRRQTDLVALQSEIARDVSSKLKTKLAGADERRLAKNYTENAEAYRLYLQGRYFWNKHTNKEVEKSIEYFQQAIALDPNYALAYAGLADALSLNVAGSTRERMGKAYQAALKAVALDDDLAEAHTALGRILTAYEYDFAGAEREMRRAIELNPDYPTAHHFLADLFLILGRHEEAEAGFRRALELEPLSVPTNTMYGSTLFLAGRREEGIAWLKKALEIDANFAGARSRLSVAYEVIGKYAESVEERAKAQELNGDSQTAALTRESYVKGGWRGFLRAMTGTRRPPTLTFYTVAVYHTALGEKDEAFVALEKSYENREISLLQWLKVDPRLDPLRDDPRFQKLLRRVGFPS